ncbi:guk1, partial [Symbiodinium necroappetens]
MAHRKVSSRDIECSWCSQLTSDMDSDDDFPDVDEIQWLKLMYATKENKDWRQEAHDKAERLWMLQRRARIYEARENQKEAQKAVRDEPKTPASERDVAWAQRRHKLKQR